MAHHSCHSLIHCLNSSLQFLFLFFRPFLRGQILKGLTYPHFLHGSKVSSNNFLDDHWQLCLLVQILCLNCQQEQLLEEPTFLKRDLVRKHWNTSMEAMVATTNLPTEGTMEDTTTTTTSLTTTHTMHTTPTLPTHMQSTTTPMLSIPILTMDRSEL